MLVSSGKYATRREVISANKERGGNTKINLEIDNGYCIYLIKNPHNLKPVYIGQTQNLKKRKRAHARRFKKVFSGELPIIEVLCYADTYDEARQLEKEKIAEYHWLGYDLLNIEDRELC
ncbi:GIY-YIG nuclease family protein [Reinekea sp. G2M2-21]|uniref:GIY-YIG nuclease family protein n=1 Tax=Reinekea sp. G2M2-21 TaxID=2788942 RepID=UPI0018A8A4BA|nr:GIY-YIG nuclease family protein [Reinekea sp. G2M2-21]